MNYKKSNTYNMIRINFVGHYTDYTSDDIDDIDLFARSLEMFLNNKDGDVFIFSDRLGNKTMINKNNICSFEFIANSDVN
ncbi:hypothetical protein BUZ34_03100 [Staphylococcus haemolyticus]|uniref:hypothetical protein n=1 Tax=Staphylococcus haemolyticus TaxID=1283 RepID=UPI000E67D218|nr:hypothetical protein [Staphylococcus haemolyticus]RIO64178.1 hypothetical protein BUZ34_03100 [Staphylococcus haemolyticus]